MRAAVTVESDPPTPGHPTWRATARPTQPSVMKRVRQAAAARPLLLVIVMAMLPDCRAGRVYFPGPSIGPAPPSLWQSLHTVRQARRLGAEDDGAPELRAAGVRLGQKYSDLEEAPPPLEPQSELRDGGVGAPRDDRLEHLRPLEPLEISAPPGIRDQFDVRPDDDPLPLRVNKVEHQQDSDSLQSLASLPFFLAAEPRGAEFSSDLHTVIPDPRGFNSLDETQHSGEFVSFGDSQSDSGPASDDFTAPDPEDVISLDEASDLSQPVLVTGQIPEGVVYAAPVADGDIFNGELTGELHPRARQAPPPRRQDLQSSASVLDSTSVERPEAPQSFRRPHTPRDPVQPRPATIAVAEGPLRPDKNLLNLLVTQGELRPVGRVRVARLRLVTGDEAKEDGVQTEQSAYFEPAPSDDGEVIARLDDDGELSEVALDDARRYRQGPNEEALSELNDEGEETQYEAENGDGERWQSPTGTNNERQRVLSSNVVPILTEKEVFDRLITPRASSSGTIDGTGSDTVGTGSDTVSESGEELVDAVPIAEDVDDRQRSVVTPRTDSLAARLTELGSRVSRQGVWGRRLTSAALRGGTGAVGSRRGRQDVRRGGWQRRIDVAEPQRRIDVGEPVFVDTEGDDVSEDLDTEGSDRHEKVAVLDEGNVLREEVIVLDEEASERNEEVPDDAGNQRQPALAELLNEEKNVLWKATSGTAPATRTDIITERTVNFRVDNSIEEGELCWKL